MSQVTEIREAVRVQVQGLQVEPQVTLGPTQYTERSRSNADLLTLTVRVLVGPESEDAERRIDNLFEDVPNVIAKNRTLGKLVSDVAVKTCSGSRLYPTKPDEPPVVGAEWQLQVLL